MKSLLDREELIEIAKTVEEAERKGSYVASHAQSSEGVINAVRAGVKTIEHGLYLMLPHMEITLVEKFHHGMPLKFFTRHSSSMFISASW